MKPPRLRVTFPERLLRGDGDKVFQPVIVADVGLAVEMHMIADRDLVGEDAACGDHHTAAQGNPAGEQRIRVDQVDVFDPGL